MPDFLSSLKDEILTLERALETDPRYIKLRELHRVLALYQDSQAPSQPSQSHDVVFSTRTGKPRVPRSMSADTKRILDEAESYLSGQSDPVPIREIYHQVIEIRGCRIGGSDPVNSLSAILSRFPQFKSHGRSGWTLVKNPSEESPSQTEGEESEAPNSYKPFGASNP